MSAKETVTPDRWAVEVLKYPLSIARKVFQARECPRPASIFQTGPSCRQMSEGDLAAAIGELKAKPEGELQVHGSGVLIRWLLDHDLVDEMNLFLFPVVVGQGTRLFPDSGPDTALELRESRAGKRAEPAPSRLPRLRVLPE